MVGIISPCALVEIELTDLPKYGGVMATPAPQGTISLSQVEIERKNISLSVYNVA